MIINKTEKNIARYDFIDILKAFSIFMIVIGHFLPENNIIRIGIYSFHIPIFFVISGYTFKETRTMKQFFNKLIKRLLYPYLFYFFISFIISVALKKSNIIDVFDIFYVNGKVGTFNSVLWFFPCFILVSINFKILYQLLGKKVWVILPLNIVLSILLFYNSSTYYFGFNKVILLTIYYTIGYLLKRIKYNKIINYKLYNKYFCFCIFFISIIIFCILNKGNNVSINLNDINNPIYFLFFSTLECIMLVLFTLPFKSNKIIRLVSNNTIFIMCTHLFFRVIIRKMITESMLIFMLGIVVFFIEVVFIYIGKKLLKNKKILIIWKK